MDDKSEDIETPCFRRTLSISASGVTASCTKEFTNDVTPKNIMENQPCFKDRRHTYDINPKKVSNEPQGWR
jgi:hypothetical protein